jgi:hypothetical protein
MHRSGTSLVAAIAHELGVSFGPEASMIRGVPDDNPRGYWEQREIVSLNDELLRRLGGEWWKPPDLKQGWEAAAELEPLRMTAQPVAAKIAGSTPRWGFKDPRCSITLPFWRSVIGEVESIVCVRQPAHVVASLQKRYRRGPRLLPAKAYVQRPSWAELWMRYTGDALRNTARAPRVVVRYDQLLNPGSGEFERLAAFLGGAGDTRQARARELIEESLWRERSATVRGLRDRRRLPEAEAMLDAIAERPADFSSLTSET